MNGRRNGFTLIELLVVIAIIAILAAILFPVFAKARAKARQITCISNEKQIGLGMMQYFQDYDERAPLFRVIPTGADWWTPRMMNWKDLIYPYVKNGGRPYNNGLPYADHGAGGVFLCPENSASWSRADVWWSLSNIYAQPGSGGDETTRYPRGYAVNDDAGVNENGGSHFWPCYGDGSCQNNTGAIASLQTPAGTIMVAESRLPFPDTSSDFARDSVTQQGQPWGGMPYGAVQGHGAGFTNFLFFDGHAKSVRLIQSFKDDLWDCFGPNGYGTADQQTKIANASSIQEWNPGF